MAKMTGGEGWSLGPDDRSSPPLKKENPASPKAKVRLERRMGKSVTVVSGLHTYGAERLNGIAKELKTLLGTGGTVKNGQIEIQGDQLKPVTAWFAAHRSV